MTDLATAPTATAPTATPVLEARGLVKRYGHVTALDGADFELYPGEILAVIGRLKSCHRAAEKSVEQVFCPRANRQCAGIGKRNVPERHDRRERQALADEPGREGKVVILDEHDRRFAVGFGKDRVRKPLVDRTVHREIIGAKDRAYVGSVAERPQPFVGEAAVIAALFLRCQPHPFQPVRRSVRRNPNAVQRVNDVSVRRAGPMRHP